MSYEFSDEDEEIILTVSNLAVLLTILIGILAIISYIDAILDEISGLLLFISAGQAFILLIIATLMISPAMAFRRVATTEGRDVEEMIGGLDVLGRYFYVSVALIAISIVLGIVGVVA